MAWVIRDGQPADVESVLLLWAHAEPSHTDNAESLGALIDHDPSALIVAEDADARTLVGSVIAAWDGWRGSIYRLVVAPSHRRLGVGSRLVHEAESRLSAAGAVRLQAIVVETDPVAKGFWQASRWEQQAHRLRFVKG
jgi:ribosomal protein S18 acetylase RimI-like enzyme